jgi:exonuclease SbcC
MKIFNLKFKNINSLSGENEIDFTNAVFNNDGLFAITGKTGAGKSSILDAISLAFYGKTPRVDITGSDNAVMTKGENDCFAEITFEVSGKIWKSSWKQGRRRNGTLSPVNRQIADYHNNIIADQVRSCDAEIIKILGLTFEQFTKVIMLAQGSFAAFLQADKNEKGQLLEQITGTEIYAEISKNVFIRNKEEINKLEKISVELENIKILTEEEIQILNNENIVMKNEKLIADKKLEHIIKAKNWLNDLSNYQYQINQAKEKLPELEEKSKSSQDAFEKSENAFKAAKLELQNQVPIFNQVRELDIRISEKDKSLNPIREEIIRLKEKLEKISQTIETQISELKKNETRLNEKKQWINDNQIYEELDSIYLTIENENKLLIESSKEIDTLNSEIAVLQNKLNSSISTTSEKTIFFNEKLEELNSKNIDLENQQKELKEILSGNEISKLQTAKENIAIFCLKIKSVIEIVKSIEGYENEIKILDENLNQFEESYNVLTNNITSDKKTIENFQNQIKLIEEKIKLTNIIQSLIEHRLNLKDGEECPLCGSLEHPFAKGNIPITDENEMVLKSLKKNLQDTISIMRQNEINLERLVTVNENDSNNKEKAKNLLIKNTEQLANSLKELKDINSTFSIPLEEIKSAKLSEQLIQKEDELKEINKIIEQVAEKQNLINRLRDVEIPALQTEKEEAYYSRNDAERNQIIAENDLKNKQISASKLEERYKVGYESFLKKLKKYSVDNIEKLKICLDTWIEIKKQENELTLQINTLKGELALNKKDFENESKTFVAKQKEITNIEIEKQKIEAKRKEIFENKSVDEEENRLNKLIYNSELTKTKVEQEKKDIDKKLAENKAIVTEKEKELINRQNEKITEKNNEELQSEFDQVKIKADEFSQKIGANNQKLKSNDDNLKASGTKLKEKQKQQGICNKWGVLNELIGSNDGKKYRNFAQALTFEHLIGLSNRQLQKMSDRYILKRTDENTNPFELAVIDKYQNNDERTAKNLSGGEKFIISLSLALGLANMASKNMRIDTMFIDEGFGTLDSDYLDVALNALSNLQSEGKVIGVISHLSELKERIATHIEVIPTGNGKSKIQITN